MKMETLSDLSRSKFKKIPILISKNDDLSVKGWRVEIADSYQNYKPLMYSKINFEDIAFHFKTDFFEVNKADQYVFNRKKDAINCAKKVNRQYLSGKAEIYKLPVLNK